MPRRPSKPFGSMLWELRQRVGLNQRRLAITLNLRVEQRKLPDYLKVDGKKISSIETGGAPPPHHPVFYEHLAALPWFNESQITQLREAAQYELAWWSHDGRNWLKILRDEPIPGVVPVIVLKYRKLSYWALPRFTDQFFEDFIKDALTLVEEEASEKLTEFLQMDDRIVLLSPEEAADSEQYWMIREGDQLTHGEGGEHQPGSKPEQGVQQAPKKGKVYERPRSHYDSDYLRENARHITNILGDALENDDPALSPDCKQALHVVIESIVKKKGASLNKVSHEKHIPHPSLADWVRKGLVPVLYRDKRTIYLANEIAEEVSHDYQDAKEMNYSAARLLRERREKYFPVEAAQSRT